MKASQLVQQMERENETLKYQLREMRAGLLRLHIVNTKISVDDLTKKEMEWIEKGTFIIKENELILKKP